MARKLMGAFYSSASNKRVLAFLGVGFLVGMALGFIAMGTIHAVGLLCNMISLSLQLPFPALATC